MHKELSSGWEWITESDGILYTLYLFYARCRTNTKCDSTLELGGEAEHCATAREINAIRA